MVRNLRLTPLCPAGHLPLKGGDRLGAAPSLQFRCLRWPIDRHESISPLEGEISGRTEGGGVARRNTPSKVPQYRERPLP
jgi:hypothetical protein